MPVNYFSFVNFYKCKSEGKNTCGECLLRFICHTHDESMAHNAAVQAWLFGGKIEAIKVYREISKLGLKESKEYVEANIIPYYS